MKRSVWYGLKTNVGKTEMLIINNEKITRGEISKKRIKQVDRNKGMSTTKWANEHMYSRSEGSVRGILCSTMNLDLRKRLVKFYIEYFTLCGHRYMYG